MPSLQTNYRVESKDPLRVVVSHSKGYLAAPLIGLAFLAWGTIGAFCIFLVFVMVSNVYHGGTVLIGIGEKTPQTVAYIHPILWIGIMVTILGFLIWWAVIEWRIFKEVLWQLFGTETIEASKETIIWTHQIPLDHRQKIFQTAYTREIRVWEPSITPEKIDLQRPPITLYHDMGSGAITFEYELKNTGIGNLITREDAKSIVGLLQQYYSEIAVKV